MGNCWSKSSEDPAPPPSTSVDPVPSPPMDSSLSTLASASGDPVPPPPMDAIKSIGEMYKKKDQEQKIGLLVSFIETQIGRMNIRSDAGSSSSEGLLATVEDVTKLAARTIDIISTEAEKLSKSYAVKQMGRATLEVMKGMAEMHWIFIGLSVAAYAVESYIRVGSTQNECRELLIKILELAKDVKQYGEQMPDQREKVCNAVSTIVEGAVICLGYLNTGKFMRFWSAKTAAEQLEKTNQQLRDVRDSLILPLGLRIEKQLTRRLEQSPLQLLDFQPVGIEEQVLEVKALMDMEGAQSALAVIVCGFGGLGKSTLAASVVQSLDWSSMDFKFCRVAIDEKTDKSAHIVKLQKDIIYDLGGDKLDLRNPDEGRARIKEVLEKKCSLLFIDNVVDKDYIRDLLPKDLSSSEQTTKLRILITSREKSVKAELKIICKEYDVTSLSDAASKHLLFQTIVPSEVEKYISLDEKHMINEAAAACRGVPLLLSVFGNHLRVARNEVSYQEDKDKYPKEIYQEALGDLRKGNLDSYQDEDLGKKLMFVFDKIKDLEVQEAFLDICTYFQGWDWNLVADIVDFPKLEGLRSRMLVSKSSSGEMIVHDILRLMGMNKANLTRFSNHEKLSDALKNNLDGFEIGNVKGISLVNDDRSITIQFTKLEAMRQSLRVLMLGDWVTLDGSPSDEAFPKLRYLRVGDITVFPFKDPSKLAKLTVFLNRSKLGMNLSHLPSSLKRISHEVPDVECHKLVKLPFQYLTSLKSLIVKTRKSVELPKDLHLPASLVDLHLKCCKNLPKDVGHLTALESLILDGSDLEHLPQGFGKLNKLKHLSMDNCSKLAFLSEERGMLSSLEAVSRNDCGRNLRALPESFGGLLCLQTLNLEGCINLQLLPQSLGGLLALQTLNLKRCINLQLLPESFGELRIHSLELDCLKKLHDLPNSLGNMPLLKDLKLKSCDSLMSLPDSFVQLEKLESLQIIECTEFSVLPEDFGRLLIKSFTLKSNKSVMLLPNSFVQLKMLETLQIMRCTKLSVLPEDFGQLRCLKHMTVEECHFLKELPRGFEALPALKTFSLVRCNSLVNLPDYRELTCLEELRLQLLPLISRIPDGLGNLKKLRVLSLDGCLLLKTLPDDFENMATLERLSIRSCPELDGAMMEKILKLPNCCYRADIDGSIKLSKKWEHMQGETEHLIVVDSGEHLRDREAERAMRVALLRGKYMEVKNGTDQLVERSSLLVGMEEGMSATVALIMLPIHIQMGSDQHPTLHPFVETARERAKANGSGELQIVCARKQTEEEEGQTPIEEEGIRQILLSLPNGSCAIPSTEYKRVKILTRCCQLYDSSRYNLWEKLSLFTANVVDVEGRKRFENLKFTEENQVRNLDVKPSIGNIINSICGLDGRDREGQSQSESVAGESKTEELMEALKGEGIEYLENDCNRSKVAVDDLRGKAIGIIICNFEGLEYIKLQQIYKDLQHKDSNFIAIWIPTGGHVNGGHGGHGSYTRLIQCMPWATFPRAHLVKMSYDGPRFVLVDEDGQIANRNALALVLGWDCGVKWYPFTRHTIRESLSSMESESCLEFFLHGMNIVGRKPMKSKITFLYAVPPNDWLKMKCQLEEITQIHGSFEVLYVGKLSPWEMYDYEELKQEYEDAMQDMRWPSLSFSDMIMFWYRCKYLASEEGYELNKESIVMMDTLHGLAKQLYGEGGLVVVVEDKGGVVTRGGYEVVQIICELWDGMRMVKEELMESLSRGECTPVVKTFFADEIHNHPHHPQHSLTSYSSMLWEYNVCDVCNKSIKGNEGRLYRCGECDWDMCGSCWRANAKQHIEQLLLANDN